MYWGCAHEMLHVQQKRLIMSVDGNELTIQHLNVYEYDIPAIEKT